MWAWVLAGGVLAWQVRPAGKSVEVVPVVTEEHAGEEDRRDEGDEGGGDE